MSNPFLRLLKRISSIEATLNRLDLYTANLLREGVVTKREGKLIEVNSEGLITKMISQSERAGDISEWSPFATGERVLILNPSGEPGKGIAFPGGYTDSNQAPHDVPAENMKRVGNASIKHTAEGFFFTVGSTEFKLTAAGFEQVGGMVKHNDHDIGDTHKHKDSMPGPDLTGVPE